MPFTSENSSNCGQDCFEGLTKDTCIVWTGPSIDALNLKTGDCYGSLMTKIANDFVEITQGKVHLRCLYVGGCDECKEEVSIPEAVKVLIDWACSLDSKQVKYNNETFCIGNNSTSVDGLSMQGRGFNYRTSVSGSKFTMSYDLTEAIKNLPAGYRQGSTRVVVSGGGGVISSSSSNVAVIVIDVDKFPIKAEFDSNIQGPTGTITLNRTVSIPLPRVVSQYTAFDVKDYTTGVSTMSHGDFTEKLAAEVCSQKNCLDSYKNMEIVGCPELTIKSGDIKDVVMGLAGDFSRVCERLDDLDNMTITANNGKCAGDEIKGISNIIDYLNSNNGDI